MQGLAAATKPQIQTRLNALKKKKEIAIFWLCLDFHMIFKIMKC